MQGYETVVILDPNTSEENQKEILAKCKETVESKGGSLVREALWGRRKLAYRVKKREYGIYHLLYLARIPEALTELERFFRYSDDVIKWQSVTVEDIEAEFAKFEQMQNDGSRAQSLND